MKLTVDQRRAAWDSMPDQHHAKVMFRLGLRCAALQHETTTDTQRARLDSELVPLIRRIETMRKLDMRGELSARILAADTLFTDIMGDWRPRPDNPIRRQVRAEIGIEL